MTEENQCQSSEIVIYKDAALPGLRIELIVLERKSQSLAATRAEYLKMINEFNEEYNRRLGDLIKKLIKLRNERLIKPSTLDASHKNAHEGTTGNSESFEKEHKEFILDPLAKLSKQDREEIKKNYRRAGRLCHPDTVDESKKQQAEKIFKSLSTAYKNGDKIAVKGILESLQSGECFASYSDIINDKILLQKKIKNLKKEIVRLEVEIERIRSDKITITISNINNMDEYFEHKKEELLSQINLVLVRSAIGDPERISF